MKMIEEELVPFGIIEDGHDPDHGAPPVPLRPRV